MQLYGGSERISGVFAGHSGTKQRYPGSNRNYRLPEPQLRQDKGLYMTRRSIIVLLLTFLPPQMAKTEVYNITFTFDWDPEEISVPMPDGAHLTQLVGASHLPGEPLWAPGEPATQGIEGVAEEGDPTTLITEVDALILAGRAAAYMKIRGLFNPPVERTKSFEFYADKPAMTLISMVAPSPDWFVGVSDLSLRDQNGWIDALSVNLAPWDAGTEDGTGFSLDNPPTVPQAPIGQPVGAPFIGSPVLAVLAIERVIPNGDINENGVLDAGDLLLAVRMMQGLLEPTLQQRGRADVMPRNTAGDPDPDGQVTVADVWRISKDLLGL